MTGIYLSTVILSALLGVALYITNTKVNKKPLFSFVFTIGIMFLMGDFIAARAQLVTFILFILEILFVECFLETKKKRYILGLMLIALLIANMHAAVFYFFFILLMPYIAEYLIIVLRNSNFVYRYRIFSLKSRIGMLSKKAGKEDKIAKLQQKLTETEEKSVKYKENLKKREEKPYRVKLIKRSAAKWLILVCILCLLMGLLTPLGDEPYTHILKLMSGTTTDNISEHQPLIFANHTGAAITAVLLVIILVFTDTKISLKDLFMIGGLLILTITSKRQFSMLITIGRNIVHNISM